MTLQAGFGRASITVFDPRLSMWGWGEAQQVPLRVVRPLHARALVLQAGDRRIAYVCCELGFISESVRAHALDQLAADGLCDHDVMLTATHTHSGPSGFSTCLFYAMPGPGFSRPVHDAIVDGVVAAVRQALSRLGPARAWVAEGAIPTSEPIAFNRALDAHHQNRDVSPGQTSEEAVDRNMVVLRVDDDAGRKLGLVSWFGLHGTCVHGDRHLLHPDHKGEASCCLEDEQAAVGNPDFVAIFAQAAAGDVTPNHRPDPRRKKHIGRFDDDLESAGYVGGVQADYAARIAADAPNAGSPVREVGGALRFVDFFSAPVDRAFAGGQRGLHTVSPQIGFGFGYGTAEGPGPFRPLRGLLPAAVRLRARMTRRGPAQARHHGGKLPFWDLGFGVAGRVSGVLSADHPAIGLLPDDRARFYRRAVTASAARDLPWVPRWLPAQVLRFGPLLVAGVPMEPTTQAARRLARAIGAAAGAGRVVVNGYANAYASYLTTPEEYALQGYEGAMTLFGTWSLGAWCTAFTALAPAAMLTSPPDDVGERPLRPDDALPEQINLVLRHTVPVHADQPLPVRVERYLHDLALGRAPLLDRLGDVFADDVVVRDRRGAQQGLDALRGRLERALAWCGDVQLEAVALQGAPDAFSLRYKARFRLFGGPRLTAPLTLRCVAREGRVAELTLSSWSELLRRPANPLPTWLTGLTGLTGGRPAV